MSVFDCMLNKQYRIISCRIVLLSQLVLGNCRFIVKLLSGVGDHLVPFITTDMSLRNVDVRNWSTVVRSVFTTAMSLICCYVSATVDNVTSTSAVSERPHYAFVSFSCLSS